ncbi:MAG: hypothetical protein V3V02_09395 [Rhizobiaceae bacterium]
MTFIPKISLETRTTASGGNTKDLWVFYIISWAIVISFAGPLLIANELYQEFNTVNVTVEWWESTIFMIAMMPILGILCAVTIGLPGLVIMYAMRKNSIDTWYSYAFVSAAYGFYCMSTLISKFGGIGAPPAVSEFLSAGFGFVGGYIFWALTTSSETKSTKVVGLLGTGVMLLTWLVSKGRKRRF